MQSIWVDLVLLVIPASLGGVVWGQVSVFVQHRARNVALGKGFWLEFGKVSGLRFDHLRGGF